MLWNGVGSVSFHHVAEFLARQFQGDPDDDRGQQQQQKSESRALIPVKIEDELVINLFREPQGALPSHQFWSQITSEGDHKHDDAS